DPSSVPGLVKNIALEPDQRSNECGNFPICKMRGEIDGRLRVLAYLIEYRKRFGIKDDIRAAQFYGIANLNLIEMSEFRYDAPEIVPDLIKNKLNLGIGFVGESGFEVGPANTGLEKPRPDRAHDHTEIVRHAAAIAAANKPQLGTSDPASDRINSQLRTLRTTPWRFIHMLSYSCHPFRSETIRCQLLRCAMQKYRSVSLQHWRSCGISLRLVLTTFSRDRFQHALPDDDDERQNSAARNTRNQLANYGPDVESTSGCTQSGDQALEDLPGSNSADRPRNCIA